MKLTSFKYLRRQPLITLALILTASSTLFSLTAFSLTGFHRGFIAYLGEEENVIVIYDKKSSTPFTGLVPTYLADIVSPLNGVLEVSPETIAPCIIRSQAVFLRGIIPKKFVNLNRLTILEGEMLSLKDFNSVIVGEKVARKLNLKPQEKILVFGVLTNHYLELKVKGIFTSNSALDDELLTPLYVGQWLRGTSYSQVTLIRIKINSNLISPYVILQKIAEASEESPSSGEPLEPPQTTITPRTIIRFKMENLGVKEAQEFMKDYVNRYGANREAILIISTTTLLFSDMSIFVAAKTLILQHKREISILRSIGASRKLLKKDLLIKTLPLTLISSIAGVTLAAIALSLIQEHGYLQVLSHTIPFQLDLTILILNFTLPLLIVSVCILKAYTE